MVQNTRFLNHPEALTILTHSDPKVLRTIPKGRPRTTISLRDLTGVCIDPIVSDDTILAV
jgi:hypothetical protein